MVREKTESAFQVLVPVNQVMFGRTVFPGQRSTCAEQRFPEALHTHLIMSSGLILLNFYVTLPMRKTTYYNV